MNIVSAFLVLASLGGFVNLTETASPEAEPIGEAGLVGWWRFDGDCKDSSGNGNDGYDAGVNFVADRNGKSNSAANFDGKTAAVIVNDSPSLSSIKSALSVSLWILPRAKSDSHWLPILCKSDRRDCVGSFRVSVYSHYVERFKRKSCFHFDVHGFGDTVGENTPCEEYFFGLIYRKWNHLVITYDGSVHRVYINGVPYHETKRQVALGQLHDQLTIGEDFVTDSKHRFFDGSMDDLRLYNRALTEDEVKELYKRDLAEDASEQPSAQVVDFPSEVKGDWVVSPMISLGGAKIASSASAANGLVGWWRFDGDCKDSSGNGNDGVGVGVGFVADRHGNPDRAGAFNGNQYVRVPNTPSIKAIDNSITMSAWFRSRLDKTARIPVLCKRSHNRYPRQYGLQLTNDRQGIMQINDESGRFEWKKQVKTWRVPFDQKWHHYALTFDGEELVAYIDGENVGCSKCPGKLQTNDDELLIGFDPPGGQEYLLGDLDDLRLYNRALSGDEVKELYNRDLAEDAKGVPSVKSDDLTTGATGRLVGTPIGGFGGAKIANP